MKHQTAFKYIREAGFDCITYEAMSRAMFSEILKNEVRVVFYGTRTGNQFEMHGSSSENQKAAADKLQKLLLSKGYKTQLEKYQNDFNVNDSYYILKVTNLAELGEVKTRKSRFSNV